jgi:hypothetical protein
MLAMPQVKEIEQILPARPARRLGGQHGIGREERREHDDVAEQEDPEAVADDDALGCLVARRVFRQMPPIQRGHADADAVRVGACLPGRHCAAC